MKVEYERGHRTGTQWTKDGLWTAEEDAIVRAHIAPEGERVRHVDVAEGGRGDRPDDSRDKGQGVQSEVPGSKRWIKIRYGGTATRGNK